MNSGKGHEGKLFVDLMSISTFSITYIHPMWTKFRRMITVRTRYLRHFRCPSYSSVTDFTSIRIPKPPSNTRSDFEKFVRRTLLAIPAKTDRARFWNDLPKFTGDNIQSEVRWPKTYSQFLSGTLDPGEFIRVRTPTRSSSRSLTDSHWCLVR
jgi:hypothetical protein